MRSLDVAVWTATLIGFLCCRTVEADTCPEPSFRLREFPVGPTPAILSVGDVNTDGKPDLILVNPSPNTTPALDVLLNSGDGSFQVLTTLTNISQLGAASLGDLNGDGNLDLITVGSNVSVHLGNGTGLFQLGSNLPTPGIPRSIATGDVNGDRRLDLVMDNGKDPSTVAVLLGRGDGTFQDAVQFAFEGSIERIFIADLNGDGLGDLALLNLVGLPGRADRPEQVAILLSKGDGKFQSEVQYAAGLAPRDIAVADLNADGKVDFVVVNAGFNPSGGLPEPTVSVLLGKGDGSFESAVNHSAGSAC